MLLWLPSFLQTSVRAYAYAFCLSVALAFPPLYSNGRHRETILRDGSWLDKMESHPINRQGRGGSKAGCDGLGAPWLVKDLAQVLALPKPSASQAPSKLLGLCLFQNTGRAALGNQLSFPPWFYSAFLC